MDTTLVSSGDPIADRRFSYAHMLADSGDFVAATELAAQALECTPDFVPGLELHGRWAEKAGLLADAFGSWRRMLALDPGDRFGAELKLASHGALDRPAAPALAYVETLFDAYADDFDAALSQRLGYRVPEIIADMLDRAAPDMAGPRFARALDLGCGTGLMAERLRRQCSYLEGVDLSEAMVRIADAKRLYDKAEQGDLMAWLTARSANADLVTAADVFAYIGELGATFAAVASVLKAGGLFAFSVEAHDGPETCVLRPSLRFAHSEAGLRAGLQAAGFEVLDLRRDVIRFDQGAPIAGLIVMARRMVPAETTLSLTAPDAAAEIAAPLVALQEKMSTTLD